MSRMLKMSPEKRRRRESKKQEKAIKKEKALRKESFQKDILKYNKLCVFNYLLFGILFLLIATECWKTNSHLVLTISIVLFGYLLFLHHTARVEKNRNISLWDYRDAFLAMKVYCATGIVVFAVLLSSALFLPHIF